jgi:predicted PurR-regulated permease PerM
MISFIFKINYKFMKTQFDNNSVYDTILRLIILLGVVVWCLLILQPFAHILLWSIILTIALFPLHSKIASKLGNKSKLASIIIVLSVFLLIFVPAGFLIDSLVEEMFVLKAQFDANGLHIPPPSEKVKELPIIGQKIFDIWNSASVNMLNTFAKYQEQLTAVLSKIFKGFVGSATAVIQILASFLIASIILVVHNSRKYFNQFFIKVAGKRGEEFADVTFNTVGNVVKGVIGVAIIVAILHGIIFLLAGVPFAGIWAVLVFILGILQIPAMLITIPVIIFLFTVKSTTVAIIWSVLLIIAGLSDNVLKPILLSKGASVPMPVIFIGVIGGFVLSGFIGLFTGAIVMSLGYKLFIVWLNSTEV